MESGKSSDFRLCGFANHVIVYTLNVNVHQHERKGGKSWYYNILEYTAGNHLVNDQDFRCIIVLGGYDV
jgi:hypothetical protein